MNHPNRLAVLLVGLLTLGGAAAAAGGSAVLLGPLPPRIADRDGQAVAVYTRLGDGAGVMLEDLSASGPWQHSEDGRHLGAVAVLPDGRVAAWLDGRLSPPCDEIRDLQFTPGAALPSYRARTAERWRVVVDGQQGPPGEALALDYHCRVASPDGRSVATATVDGGKWTMLLNARPVGGAYAGFDEACPALSSDGYRRPVGSCRAVLSADGKHLAFVALLGGTNGRDRATVVLDGKQGAIWERVRNLTLSDTGGHCAYTAAEGDREYLVVDGVRSPAYEGVEDLLFSRDGAHLACVALQGDTSRVVRDGKQVGSYEAVSSLVFSPDGRHLAWAVTRGGKCCVLVDGKPGPWLTGEVGMAYASSGLPPAFSPDSRHLAYVVSEDNGYRLVVDGTAGPRYEQLEVPYPIFTAAGRVIYVATAGEKQMVVADGQPGAQYEQVSNLTISPDGRHYACVARRGEQEFVVADGTEQTAYSSVRDLCFADDSSALGYLARLGEGRYAVVVSGRQAAPLSAPTADCLRFSGDLAHWTCLARQAGRRACLVTDGVSSPEYDQVVLPLPRADAQGAVPALVVRGGQLYRLGG